MQLLNSQEISNIFSDDATAENNEIIKRKPHIDLKIDKIYVHGVLRIEYMLKPNEVAYVCSKKISLGNDQIGFLGLKKNFDRIGLLTVCSKTVDPGYKGPLSAKIVNISGEEIPIRKDDSFLEMLVFKVENKFDEYPFCEKEQDYLGYMKKNSENEPGYFLNINNIQSDVANKILNEHGWGFIKKFTTTLGIFSGAIMIFFAVITTVATFKIFGYINDYSQVESIEEIQQLKLRLRLLEEVVKNKEMKKNKNL